MERYTPAPVSDIYINGYRYYQDIIIINHKKPSLDQGIFRSSFIIPTYRFLSCSSPTPTRTVLIPSGRQISLAIIYNIPGYILHTALILNNIHFLIFFQVFVVSKRTLSLENKFTVISPLPVAFSTFSKPTNLLSYNYYPLFPNPNAI